MRCEATVESGPRFYRRCAYKARFVVHPHWDSGGTLNVCKRHLDMRLRDGWVLVEKEPEVKER